MATFILDSKLGWPVLSCSPSPPPGSSLLDIPPKNCIILKTFVSEFSKFEVWFNHPNFKPLLIEDKINITLVIN